MIDIFDTSHAWQMTFGERAAMEGILSQLRPKLAIEIGTAEGGSLRCIARHSKRVHSFDLVVPAPEIAGLENVTLHTGDSHALLPELLEKLAHKQRNVDFVLVDGDHTPDGVERDVRDLLGSDAISSTVILLHDAINDEVRAGLKRIDYGSIPKVAHVELDFVGGHLSQGGDFDLQLWGGLGMIVVEGEHPDGKRDHANGGFYDNFEMAASVRDALVAREREGDPAVATEIPAVAVSDRQMAVEADRLRKELESTRRSMQAIQDSASWRVTAPLRAAKRAAADYRESRGSR